MPGAHRRKPTGRHRKPSPLALTWRTTGGVIVGAAVLGTAAATAQASVLPFDSLPTTHITAADLSEGKAAGKSSPEGEDGSGSRSKDGNGGGSEAGGKNDGGKGDGEDGGRTGKEEPEPGAPKEPSEDSRPTADDAIELAKAQVGITEDGSGETKFNRWYVESPRAKETVARDGGSTQAYDDAAWCSMFISWLGDRLGVADQFGSDAWTVAHAEWFRDQGRWGTEPKPGAIVFYAWDGGKDISDIVHVGMVTEKVDDDTIKAVEGNTDSAVKIRERSAGDIVGYGYPEYKS
ncbi:CHAP domain-containing protein [Actinomadura sp. 7K507]|uniref:CHAP domain-containing protein n=1 Tax=Actinomadura sp. 7K507 TaxID=2530365 RepID=UPI001053DED5|nr:CHAP domain-containing protein [Actinomadura sp. 7K507]TDC94889.1 CHAP domain-containing protein [Actinomadura sp. 7K507]